MIMSGGLGMMMTGGFGMMMPGGLGMKQKITHAGEASGIVK